MVVMNTSSIPMVACLIGVEVAVAWAMGPLPSPASLAKMPRAIPNRTAIIAVAPAKPPCAAVGVKASSMTCRNIAGTSLMFKMMMSSEASVYRVAMKGTIFPATLPMRRRPPNRTEAISRNRISAVIHVGTPKVPQSTPEMALVCTALPVPKQVIAAKMANRPPSHFHFSPSPFLMKYMAPPTKFPAGVTSR